MQTNSDFLASLANAAYVKENVDQTTILLQLAEECSELAQQALKLVRIYEGKNPTPVTAIEASDGLHEEIADVFVVLDCLEGVNFDRITEIHDAKLKRWCKRLENSQQS